MKDISIEVRTKILDEVLRFPNFLGNYEEHDGILTFLEKIWDLKSLPSQDTRFKNARDDAYQHLVNNDDWTYEYLFNERFDIINSEIEIFFSFINAIVHPTLRKNKNEILFLVTQLNLLLESTSYKLVLTSYFEEKPIYKILKDAIDLPIDIVVNDIPIYLDSFNGEKKYPSFTLKYDNWNDYGYRTLFDLNYFESNQNNRYIGKVKIMKPNTNPTYDSLLQSFTQLTSEFCSLGDKESYYTTLKDILGNRFSSFLLALRDVAIFPKIYEQFENDNIFKTSLIRFNESERLSRTIRYQIEGINANEYFKFNYLYKPPFADNSIVLNFDFEYNTDFEHRLYAIIGKNGTGKTRLLSSLAKSLSQKENTEFSPRKPMYSKVFTVSYSFFDRFEIPYSDASFNYVYCGLKKGKDTFKTEDELIEQFYKTATKIKERALDMHWNNILSRFLSNEIIEQLQFKELQLNVDKKTYVFDYEKFNSIKYKLSSGQNIILYLVSEILAQIRFDSLILFDEPETHLHPNAISALINTIFELVRTFQSFCIIATHSPIIIQEIPARNIFVIERDENKANIRGLERESFGENLTIITQDIFGNREVPRHFIKLISELVSKGKQYSEIVSILETENLPISSNISLYIKSLMTKN
jgi:predicted ATPase